MDYQTIPQAITEWTPLSDFDEYEAQAAGWPQNLIRDALREIWRRELMPNCDRGEIADYGRPPARHRYMRVGVR